MSTRIDVVIPSLNGLAFLETCLPPLLGSVGEDGLRIVVVDDGSEDGTSVKGPLLYPSVEFCSNPGTRGFSHAVNFGARNSTGEFLLLLNNDVLVDPDTPGRLASFLSSAPPAVFAVMPSILRNDGSDESLLRCSFRHGLASITTSAGIRYPSGACCLFRTGEWRRLDGMDTRFAPAYWEDVDLGLRAHGKGLWTERAGEIVVHHRHAATSGHGREMMRIRERNRFILMDAHFRRRKVETAFYLPLHALTAVLRGRWEFVEGWMDYLRWRTVSR